MKKAIGTSKKQPMTLEDVVRRQASAKVREDIARLHAMKDDEIDLSDIPEVTGETGWVRNPFCGPVTKGVTIRLTAPDVAVARALSRRKGMPCQTYIKQLLHGALERELAELEQ